MAAAFGLLTAVLASGCVARTVEFQVKIDNTTPQSQSGRFWIEGKQNETVYTHEFSLPPSEPGPFRGIADPDDSTGPPTIRLKRGTYQGHAAAGNLSGTSNLELRTTGGTVIVTVHDHTMSFIVLPGPDG